MSNPSRFSLDVRADRQIHFLAAAGFGCTIIGLSVLVAAAGHTTMRMPKRNRANANMGVGLGMALQFAGLFLLMSGDSRAPLGLVLLLAGVPVLIWGCMEYAAGKGYAKWIGIAGAAGILGPVILIVLPDRSTESRTEKCVS